MTEQLLQRAIEGSRPALGELLEELAPHLAAAVRRHVASTPAKNDADDIVQESMRRIAERIRTFELRGAEPIKGFEGWARAIAHSIAIDWVRGRRGSFARIAQDIEVFDKGITPARAVRKADRLKALEEAVRKLNDPSRRAVQMYYFQGMSHEEIAEALGQNREAVKKVLQRALKRLAADVTPPSSIRLKPSRRLEPP